jgi:hypothetical protein
MNDLQLKNRLQEQYNLKHPDGDTYVNEEFIFECSEETFSPLEGLTVT